MANGSGSGGSTPWPGVAGGGGRLVRVEADALDLRGPVLALAVWAGTWLGIQGRPEALGVCAVAGVGALLWGRRNRLVGAVGLLLLGCLVTAGLRAAAMHSGEVPALAQARAVVEVEVILGPGRYTPGASWGAFWSATAQLETVQEGARRWSAGQQVQLVANGELADGWNQVAVGSRVRAWVKLEPAEPEDAFAAVGRAREPPEVTVAPNWVDAGVHRVRTGLREAVAGLSEEPRAVVPALVVGDVSAVDSDLQERFRVTGLLHLMAVSGANLTLLLASLLWVARRMGVRGWWLRGVAVVGVAGFVVLCHGEPSVLRAAAMGTVGLAALGWGGRAQGMRYLAWAVIGLLLLDPWLASSVGFALSVVASAGIVGFARSWTDALSEWMPRGLAEAFAVPLAAQLATQPIVVALSGQVSLVGLLANVAAGPLVGPVTVVGFGCAALGWWAPGPAATLGWLAGWGAQALCWIAALGAKLPSAAIDWPAGPAGVGLLVGFGAAGYLVLGSAMRHRWLVLVLAGLLVFVLLRPWPVPGWPPTGWTVVQCDVGQGAATVVASGSREAIVVDTGTQPALLENCLAGLGIERVPLLVVTHLHADHVGGVAALADRQVQQVVMSEAEHPAEGRAAVLAATPGAQQVAAVPGMVFAVGDARLEVVSVLPVAGGNLGEAESSAENDGSVVVRIKTPQLTVLATGDIEQAGQSAVLSSGADLASDVLVVPHHGSADQSPELLAAVGASIALIGVGKGNDYGHPSATALRLLAEAGTAGYRTDVQGAVAVSATEAGLLVTTER